MHINIVTYNIHEGKTAFLKKRSIHKILDRMEEENADIICMQEVMHSTLGDFRHSQVFALERWAFCVYGKNAHLRHGCKGNAVLSRFPITRWMNTDVSVRKSESRGILLTSLKPRSSAPELTVINLHFGLRPKERIFQRNRLIELVKENVNSDAPLIIAGDFNDWRQKIYPVLEKELGVANCFYSKYGRHGATFPSLIPSLALDHIYLRNCSIGDISILQENSRWGLSDHIPVKVRLEF